MISLVVVPSMHQDAYASTTLLASGLVSGFRIFRVALTWNS